MEKRQGIIAAVAGLVILAAAAFWWFTQNPETSEVPPASTTAAQAPAPVLIPTSIAPNTTAIESDAVALSEEHVDAVNAEKTELASRATDLESQVNDGKALIALKEKQIKELESKLQKSPAPHK